MAKFYYTPFMYTDENERRTWNYYVGKGATFVTCTSPSKSDRMAPTELGEVLATVPPGKHVFLEKPMASTSATSMLSGRSSCGRRRW